MCSWTLIVRISFIAIVDIDDADGFRPHLGKLLFPNLRIWLGLRGCLGCEIRTEEQDHHVNAGEIYVEGASWIDGFGESGLIVEQFLPKSKFSSFVSSQSCQLTAFHDGSEENKIIENCDLESVIKKYDLTLSVSDNKVYIQGQVLTSKEIFSAKATIDIFKKLLKNPDFKLSNREFRQTSHGQNRYDLQSKIFIPLNKALKKLAKKEIEFKISGGIYDDFRVSIDPKNISIVIINDIN